MKLWKKVLAAVTAGVLCLGSVGVSVGERGNSIHRKCICDKFL